MKINGNIELQSPEITLEWSWTGFREGFTVMGIFSKGKKSYGREIGKFFYSSDWTFVPNAENTEDVNEFFKNIIIEDLGIEDLSYYIPPEMSKYGILIPEKYQFIFREYVFKVGGFEVPLEDDAKGLYVNVSYLGWQAFKDELDAPHNAFLKLALEPVWDYAKEQAEKNNLILLEEF